jgi:hypothetical protein
VKPPLFRWVTLAACHSLFTPAAKHLRCCEQTPLDSLVQLYGEGTTTPLAPLRHPRLLQLLMDGACAW